MQGKTLIYRAVVREPLVQDWPGKGPDLDFLQAAVGGYIEAVPHLETIELDGKVQPCVAYCHEEGKLEGRLFNAFATQKWHAALMRITNAAGEKVFPDGLGRDGSKLSDFLVGDIVVVTGDEAFMRHHREGDEDDDAA